MFVRAVVQLDRIIREINVTNGLESLLFFHRQLSLLSQCRRVDDWICLASSSEISSVPPALPASLGMTLQETCQGDSLDQFHYAACNDGTADVLEGALVLRLELQAEDPIPWFIDALIDNHLHCGYDYSYADTKGQALATPLELMTLAALEEAWREALLPDDRQQVTPYIFRQRDRLKIGRFSPLSHSNHEALLLS